MVAPLSIKEFPALVEKAQVMEKLKAEVEAQQRPQQKMGGSSVSMSRHEDRGKPYSRPQPQGPRRPTHQPQQFQPHRAQCFLCGGPHMKNACPRISSRRTCHGCGKEGHFIRDCPTSRNALSRPSSQSQPQQSRGGVIPQAAGRVYTMTGTEAVRSGNLIIGSCMIAGRSLCVLYDSGATHSFVSESKVLELGLPVREL